MFPDPSDPKTTLYLREVGADDWFSTDADAFSLKQAGKYNITVNAISGLT